MAIIILRGRGGDRLNLSIDYKGNKGFRLLSIYECLNKGEIIEKRNSLNVLELLRKLFKGT